MAAYRAALVLLLATLAASGAPAQPASEVAIEAEHVRDQHFATGPEGQTRLLLRDGTTLTLGPNSDVTIDEFDFDPATGASRLTMTQRGGVLRFAGLRAGREQPVVLRTPSAVIDIAGGVNVTAVDAFGGTVTSQPVGTRTSLTAKASGVVAIIERSGGSISVGSDGSIDAAVGAALRSLGGETETATGALGGGPRPR